ncbi:MAG: Dabb family protein [Rhizobiaceae bacterium]|nr:Dabb family protein [Rhizobiaceae bacterium]
MIRHCVFINFEDDVTEVHKGELFSNIEALRAHLPGILAVHIGTNVSPEGMDKGFSDGFMVDFLDAAARDTYLADADHAKAGAGLVAAAKQGVAGIFVYDIELPD